MSRQAAMCTRSFLKANSTNGGTPDPASAVRILWEHTDIGMHCRLSTMSHVPTSWTQADQCTPQVCSSTSRAQ